MVSKLSGIYSYVPVKQLYICMIMGVIAFVLAAIAGLTNEFVSTATAASRGAWAGACAGVLCFIVLMSIEEWFEFKTKQNMADFVSKAELVEVEET